MKCSNKHCEYGLPAYSNHHQYKGLCLNCLDDDRQDLEMFETELRLDEQERNRKIYNATPKHQSQT